MRITLKLNETVDKNASLYFEKSKKAKKKVEGAKKALVVSFDKLKKLEQEASKLEQEKPELSVKRKKHWFEKFRWFITSDGFLVVGGRDATTNEIIIKKHAEPGDLVFHTDMAGSPFMVIKSEGKEISDIAIKETADFTATFSRAFKAGFTTTAVFYVTPDQVTKEAQAGEFLAKGAFMIRGKTTYVDCSINLAMGLYEDAVMSGPVAAVKAHCKEIVEIVQGTEKASEIAKKIKKVLGADVDDIIRQLPAGEFKLKR